MKLLFIKIPNSKNPPKSADLNKNNDKKFLLYFIEQLHVGSNKVQYQKSGTITMLQMLAVADTVMFDLNLFNSLNLEVIFLHVLSK